MTLKSVIVVIGSALVAGALAFAYVGLGNLCAEVQSQNICLQGNPAKIEKAEHCKYLYDEMAHKLVAYSASETCPESKESFTSRLGSRILDLTKTDQETVTL